MASWLLQWYGFILLAIFIDAIYGIDANFVDGFFDYMALVSVTIFVDARSTVFIDGFSNANNDIRYE